MPNCVKIDLVNIVVILEFSTLYSSSAVIPFLLQVCRKIRKIRHNYIIKKIIYIFCANFLLSIAYALFVNFCCMANLPVLQRSGVAY